MFKPWIAGITALSLTLAMTSPVQANGLDREDMGKLLFGLAAVAVVGAAINNNNRDNNRDNDRDNDRATQRTQTVQHGRDRNRSWAELHRPQQRRFAELPRECLRSVETRFGTQRLFTERCLQRSHVQVNRLPNRCAVRLFTTQGPRNGFDPLCLREQGYRIDRRH